MNRRNGLVCGSILLATMAMPGRAEKRLDPEVHKLAPTIGVYAPDRFRTTLSASLRYEYNMRKSYAFGVSAGAVNVSQEYFADAGMGAPEQGEAFSIFYYGRFLKTAPMGPFTRYGILGFGITRQHSESNITGEIGAGLRIPWTGNYTMDLEVNDYIFPSDHVDGFFINNNMEVSLGISFFL